MLKCTDWVRLIMQANEDIESSIPLLSETGPIAIPLSCLIKRAVISVQPQVRTLRAGLHQGHHL